MSLHQSIKNVYLKSVRFLFPIEVQTDGGWNQIDSLNITEISDLYQVETASTKLVCTKNHILIDENDNEILAVQSKGKKIKTTKGIEIVLNVVKTNQRESAFDLTLHDGTNHLYYANGLLSHNCVVADEFSFVPNNIASKVFESIYPTISSSKNSQFIIVSTPNGADPKNLYYEIWQKANSKQVGSNAEGWKAFRFDWWDVPGRDEQWKQNTIASIGQQRFDQEFGNVFLSSASLKKLIPDDITEQYRIKLSELKVQDKDFAVGKKQLVMSEKQDKMYEFRMWHEFQPGRTYLASGDAAEGVGADSSVLYVWDVTDLSNIVMCAKFASNVVSPVEFAFITAKVLGLYNNPYYICERNGVGAGYLDSLRITYHYPNIVAEGKNRDYGVYSHVQIKGKACLWAREMMTTLGFGWTIYDKDLLNDFNNFVKKETKGINIVYQGLPPAHDDHIMAWIWACYVLQPDVVESYYVCTKSFTSQLDKIYPQLLMPLYEYKYEDIKKIADDPTYQEFLDFKEEINNKLGRALAAERKEAKADPFAGADYDPYFGDTGPSWNEPDFHSGSSRDTTSLNPYNNRPSFAINLGGGFGI